MMLVLLLIEHEMPKAAGKQPGCWYGGITLRSGKKGWAIYKGGKVVEMYAVMRGN